MDEESAGRWPWDALAEISRSLDSLRQLVQSLEGPERAEIPSPAIPSAIRGVDVGEPLHGAHQATLAALSEILSIPLTGPELGEVLGLAIDRLMRLTFVDRSVVFLFDADEGRLLPRAARGFRRADLIATSLLPGEGLVGRAFREGRPLVYQTPWGEPSTDPLIFRFPVRDAVTVPIYADGDVVGVLFAGRRGKPTPFTAEELQLMTLLADRIGTALAHRWLMDRLGGQMSRMKELVELSARTGVRHDIREVLAMASEAGARLLKASASLVAVRGEGEALMVTASHGLSEEAITRLYIDAESGVTRELFQGQQLVVCPDLHVRPDDDALKGLGIRALLVVPLRSRGEMVGGLYVVDSRAREFSSDEAESAGLLAALVGLAIENDRLYREVRQAFDRLTAAQERLIQTEKARALEAMAGGVAHEFNNILAIMIGKMQLVLGGVQDEALRTDLQVIEEAAWRAADVVRRLQRFTATRTAEEPIVVDLNGLVQEAVELSRARWKDEAEAQGIKVEVLTDLAESAWIVGSPTELREMLLDLILNALDAMPRGGRLSLATQRRGDRVDLSVGDTGTGMSEAVKRRVFDPFFTTRSPQRTGLGLSVVQGIVTRHHGSIDVESREGGGTTFMVSFPLAQALAREPAATPAAGETWPASARVLVIEDEEHIRRMLEELLVAAGHDVETARDGLEGLARFRSGRYDVVITDLSMPERSGLEVSRAVKHLAPATPVILMTGWGDLIDPTRVRESGADLTLTKPFLHERALGVLADALRLRRGP